MAEFRKKDVRHPKLYGEKMTDKAFAYKLSKVTPYTREEILELQNILEMTRKESEVLIKNMSIMGISNLKDIRLFILMGKKE